MNGLLEIFSPAQIFFVDLRSPSEFQRSHIHSAVNLRVPSKFLGTVGLDELDRTFPDEQSRRSFTRWTKTKCMVIYDRHIEAPWECPTAPGLLDMLRREGWSGRCFVLKGPLRDFSLSFDKYITGDRMTKDSKSYTDSLRAATPPDKAQHRRHQARYDEWLRRVQHEGSLQAATVYSKPQRDTAAKMTTVDEYQRELEAEFCGRFPDLYRKIKDGALPPPPQQQQHPAPAPPPKHGSKETLFDDSDACFDTRKAHLVGSLSSGLAKLRDPCPPAGYDSAAAGSSLPHGPRGVPDKLGELPSPDVEDDDEIDPREAPPSPYGGSGGGRSPAPRSSGDAGATATATPLDHAARRLAREARGKQGLWKRLRSSTSSSSSGKPGT